LFSVFETWSLWRDGTNPAAEIRSGLWELFRIDLNYAVLFTMIRIRARQLPTDHDCAVPTREYQSDHPSR